MSVVRVLGHYAPVACRRCRVEMLRDKLTKGHPKEYPPALLEIRDAVWITGANGNGISYQMSTVRLEPGFGQKSCDRPINFVDLRCATAKMRIL